MAHFQDWSLPNGIYRPLIPLTLSLMVGIAVGVWQPGLWIWSTAGILAGLVVLGIHFAKKRKPVLSPLILLFLAGYLSIQPWLGCIPSSHHVVRHADQGYWTIQGEVVEPPVVNGRRWRFVLAAERLTDQHRCVEVHGLIRVTGRGKWPGAGLGDKVVLRGRLRTVRGFTNPGGFDYERHMRLKGILARVYASANSLKIESRVQTKGIIHRVQSLGEMLSLRMETALESVSPESVGLLKALILGKRDQISVELREKFNRAGLGHVLAISGLHVGMVATLSFVVAVWILPVIPAAVDRGWCRKGAALFSLGPVLVYGILAGLSPSTQRAMLMVSVVLFGFWIGRRHDWLNSLALAALVILVWHPPALLTISFQLSFVAVLAILIGSLRWPEGRDEMPKGTWMIIRRRFFTFVRISAFAIAGTLPLVLHYFNQTSTVGLATNLIAVPLVGMVVVPAGLMGALAIAVHPEVGCFFWQIAAWGADAICWTVHRVASWPWASIKVVTPTAIEILLFYVLCGVGLVWRKLPWRTMVLCIVTILCLLDIGFWWHQRYGRSDLRVTALDVGQASANLLELPEGYTVMVDGGGFSDNSIFDVGARVLAPILWRKKIKTVDLVVLTHANSDHLNGLLYIVDHFNVTEVWSNHEAASTKGYGRWVKLLTRRDVRHLDFNLLPRQVARKGVQFEILWPPRGFQQQARKGRKNDMNNNSLVLRVSKGAISFLFTGDIMEKAESDLKSRIEAQGLRSTVLMVPHHGSRTSSSMDFLTAVAPAEAVISAGWQNRFKFPHPEVLNRLKSKQCRIWCTADSGAVELVTDGEHYSISTFRLATP